MIKPAWILMILLVSGCASTPQTPEQEEAERLSAREKRYASTPWEAVRLTSNPDAVRGCASLGNVSAEATDIVGTGQESVQKSLKKQAAEKGGNVVFLMALGTNRMAEGTGEIYSCTASPEATPTPK